jgi:sugar O-acyltransferase (sialic acid O-acetyltransferase NeuD family)
MADNTDKKAQIVIIGTGADARIAMDAFASSGYFVLGLISEAEEKKYKDLNDVAVFASIEEEDARKILKDPRYQYFLAVGDIGQREEVYQKVVKITKRPATVATHITSWISQYTVTGYGNLYGAGVVIQANVQVGDHNFFHTGCSVEPDTVIGNYCTFASGVHIGGNVTIADGVFVGTGAIIHPGVKIGKGVLIGAGSVVLKDVKANKKVFGNPAIEV